MGREHITQRTALYMLKTLPSEPPYIYMLKTLPRKPLHGLGTRYPESRLISREHVTQRAAFRGRIRYLGSQSNCMVF